MRNSLLEELNDLTNVKSPKYASSLVTPKSLCNPSAAEYEKRIKNLEEENCRIMAEKLNDELIDLLAQNNITIDFVIQRLSEITKDQLLREKENQIKGLLDQIAYYKNQRQEFLVKENTSPQKSENDKSAIHIALEKAKSDQKEKSTALEHSLTKLRLTEQMNKQLESEILVLKNKVAELKILLEKSECELVKIRQKHNEDLDEINVETQKALDLEVKTMEQTEQEKIRELNKHHENEIHKLKLDSEERLRSQREILESKISELETNFANALKKTENTYKKEIKNIQKSNISQGSEEIKRLRSQLEEIQQKYGNLTEKSAQIIQNKFVEFQKDKENEIFALKNEYESAKLNQENQIKLLQESFKQNLVNFEKELGMKTSKINELEKQNCEFCKNLSELQEKINFKNDSNKLLENDNENLRKRVSKLEQIFLDLKAKLSASESELQKTSHALQNAEKELDFNKTKSANYKHKLDIALLATTKAKSEILKFREIKSEMNIFKSEFGAIKIYYGQKLEILIKLVKQIRKNKPEAYFDKALNTMKESINQVCDSIKSSTFSPENTKFTSAKIKDNNNQKELTPKILPELKNMGTLTDLVKISEFNSQNVNSPFSPSKSSIKTGCPNNYQLKRIKERIMPLKTALQNIKLSSKDFILRMRENMLNFVTTISHAHFNQLMVVKEKYKREIEKENNKINGILNEKVQEKEETIKKLKEKLTGLVEENNIIHEKMSLAEQEAIKIDKLLKDKKSEKVSFQKELGGILSQMKDVKEIVSGECKTVRKIAEDNFHNDIKKSLKALSVQTLKNKPK